MRPIVVVLEVPPWTGAKLACKSPERKSGIPPRMGYVRPHSPQLRVFSAERRERLHLGQAKLTGLVIAASVMSFALSVRFESRLAAVRLSICQGRESGAAARPFHSFRYRCAQERGSEERARGQSGFRLFSSMASGGPCTFLQPTRPEEALMRSPFAPRGDAWGRRINPGGLRHPMCPSRVPTQSDLSRCARRCAYGSHPMIPPGFPGGPWVFP